PAALVAALVASLVAAAAAQAGYENAGTTAANFLALGSGPRTLAMGGAILGLGDDAPGAAWNPAALGWVNGTEAALSHAGLPNRSLQEWGVVGGRIGGSQTRWAVTGLYHGDGTVEGRDATGASTGSISVSSLAAGATLARQLGGRATFGLGAKAVREDIASASGSGFTLDAGLMVRAGRFGLGVAAQNLGGRMSYGASTYPFPTSYGVGLGFVHPNAGLRVGVDANFPSAYHPDLRAGAEWIHRGVFALRAGYRKELGSVDDPLDGPSFGVGASHQGLWLDYAYLLSGIGSGQHRMGLRVRLGGPPAANGAQGKATKPEKPGEFDWARDGARLGPGKPPGHEGP
ncbi:MAG: PorV/PorQ family protein, partial [Candidatus Eiseniibacteriota bacterium]